ncbi:MAG TPA: hypothetical protein VNJ46_10145 [Gaiellaceae bacterium]|nr:hypothetical protein [Gaiellaceae bacterium]
MSEPWENEGFGAENDWDEGEESLLSDLEETLGGLEEEEEGEQAGWDEREEG